MKHTILLFGIIMLSTLTSLSQQGSSIRMFTGTYTKDKGHGLFIIDVDPVNGTYKPVSDADAGPNPSYICISHSGKFIYAANEVGNFLGVKGGGVTALAYNAATGSATKIGELAVPNGGPAYIAISPDDQYLFFANYGGGSVAVVRLNEKGIPVSVSDEIRYNTGDKRESHAHMIAFDPAGKRVYVTDLGLNRVVAYDFDKTTGKLSQIAGATAALAEGAGPRHFVFTEDGKKLYVINELNSTITFFNVRESGALEQVQTVSTLRAGFTGKSYCADIHLGKGEKFLYGSNRGENTIVTFSVGKEGKLTLAGHNTCGGEWPRNFVIDPSGKYLLVGNQNSGNIALFKIDEKTGLPTGPSYDYKLEAPVCLKFIGGR